MIPFLLFPLADGAAQSLFHPHTSLLVGEKREFSRFMEISPEMEMFQELVLTKLVRHSLTHLVIPSGKFLPELCRLPR